MTGKIRVLIVEDDPVSLKLLTLLMQSNGYEVSTATDGAAALASLHRSLPSVMLLDIGLPDLDGFSIVKRLRDDPATQHLPIVAVTAYALKADMERARATGFDAYIVKPVHETAVVEVVRLLAERELTAPAATA